MLWIPHQLVGAPQGYNVTLECFTEAHPASLNYWTREDGQMIHDTGKYRVESRPMELPYKTQMLLTIVELRRSDFGTYKCVAKNPRGETDGTIRLYGNMRIYNLFIDFTVSSAKSIFCVRRNRNGYVFSLMLVTVNCIMVTKNLRVTIIGI